MVVTAKVNAPSGTTLSSTATISSSNPETNPANNSATATAKVADLVVFNGATKISMNTQGTHVLLLRGGIVWAWGLNALGQLGDGTNSFRTFPTQVDDLMNVKDISAGASYSVALKNDGTVWTWGTNEKGQLATGSETPNSVNRPVKTTLSDITAISAGTIHAMALKSDGTVWTWGWNADGELGLGTQDFASHPTPAQVPGLTNVVRIFAGAGLSWAVKADGTVFGWGFASAGRFGNGISFNTYTSPVELPALKNTIAMSSGSGVTIAIKQDQSVWSFGINTFGQLGRGIADTNIYPVPGQIENLAGKAAASGNFHSLVLLNDGTIKAFGGNGDGQLGLGNDFNIHNSPVSVPGISGAFAVAAGNNSSFALIGDPSTGGTIKAWGSNDAGVLGIGSFVSSRDPVQLFEALIVAKPIFSVPGGTIFSTAVQIVCSTPDAVIHYTTNGSDPTESDPIIASGSAVLVDHSLTLKARAFRSGFAASPVRSEVYTVVPPPPIELLLDSSGPAADQLTAFESVALLRDPFPIINLTYLFNLGADQNSRILVFARNVTLGQGETAAAVIVNLVDSNSQSFDIPAEDVRAVANMDFVQGRFRLPDNLAAGTCTVRIKFHGQTSNAGTMRIKP